jgi:hypothetical protein
MDSIPNDGNTKGDSLLANSVIDQSQQDCGFLHPAPQNAPGL